MRERVLVQGNDGYIGPEPMPNVDWLDCMLGWYCNWSEWRELRGGGIRSFAAWFWSTGSITADEGHRLMHLKMAKEGKCHRYQGHEHHYCHSAEIRNFERRLERV